MSKQTPERAWGDALQGQKLWKVSACREHILQGTNSVERERGVTRCRDRNSGKSVPIENTFYRDRNSGKSVL